MQTSVRVVSRGREAVSSARRLLMRAWDLSLGDTLVRLLEPPRRYEASLLVAAVITTLIGARCSSASSDAANGAPCVHRYCAASAHGRSARSDCDVSSMAYDCFRKVGRGVSVR